jgi:serine/threonine protein phosphatase PrpC
MAAEAGTRRASLESVALAKARAPAPVALLGADHPDLGSVAVRRIDAEAVVALSAGRYPKPYPHLDANEDAALAAIGERCRLLAVADGHNGFDAAAGAIRGLQDALGRLDSAAADPAAAIAACARAAVRGVREALRGVAGPRRGSRTALTVALIVPGGAHIRQWGDTAGLRLRDGRARLLAPPAPFLSVRGEEPAGAEVRVRPDDLLVAASDGLTTYLGHDWTERVADVVSAPKDLEDAARGLVDAAFRGGAGDHVAVGLVFAGPET